MLSWQNTAYSFSCYIIPVIFAYVPSQLVAIVPAISQTEKLWRQMGVVASIHFVSMQHSVAVPKYPGSQAEQEGGGA